MEWQNTKPQKAKLSNRCMTGL